jgi:hypothetical protein
MTENVAHALLRAAPRLISAPGRCFAILRSFLLCAAVLAGQPTPPAPLVKWTGSLSAGTTLEAGRAFQRSTNVTFNLARSDPHNAISVDTTYLRSTLKIADKRLTAADRTAFNLMYERPLNNRLSLVTRGTAERDTLRLLAYRLVNLSGVGITVAKTTRFEFHFTPGIAVATQDKGSAALNGSQFGVGGFEALTYRVGERWSVTHYAIARTNVQDVQDLVIDSKTSLTGMMTKRLGLELALLYNYEGLQAAPAIGQLLVTRNFLGLTAGFRFAF